MAQSNLEPYLKTGTNLAALTTAGKRKIKQTSKFFRNVCFRRIKILFGILKRPIALLMFREEIMLAISSRYVDYFKYSEKCLCE